MANGMGSLPTTTTPDAAPTRRTPLPRRIPGMTLPPSAASPFGPVRKNQPKPPVKIPGQRQPSGTLTPRPTPPQSALTADRSRLAQWWNHAEEFLTGDTSDQAARVRA